MRNNGWRTKLSRYREPRTIGAAEEAGRSREEQFGRVGSPAAGVMDKALPQASETRQVSRRP